MTYQEISKCFEQFSEDSDEIRECVQRYLNSPSKYIDLRNLEEYFIEHEYINALDPILKHYATDLRGCRTSHNLGDILCRAISKGKLKVVEKLVSIPETDILFDEGWALLLSVNKNNVEMLSLLLNTEQVKRSMRYVLDGYMSDIFNKIIKELDTLMVTSYPTLNLFLENIAFQEVFGEDLKTILEKPLLTDPTKDPNFADRIRAAIRNRRISDEIDLQKQCQEYKLQSRFLKIKEYLFILAEKDLRALKDLMPNNQVWIEECAEQFEGVAIWYPYLQARERKNIIESILLPFLVELD